jgi:hypothetical protein
MLEAINAFVAQRTVGALSLATLARGGLGRLEGVIASSTSINLRRRKETDLTSRAIKGSQGTRDQNDKKRAPPARPASSSEAAPRTPLTSSIKSSGRKLCSTKACGQTKICTPNSEA